MHRSGIIPDVKPRASNQLRKLRDSRGFDHFSGIQPFRDFIDDRFFPRSTGQDDRKIHRLKRAGKLGKSRGRPTFCFHQCGRMYDGVWLPVVFRNLKPKRGWSRSTDAKPPERFERRFDAMKLWLRRRQETPVKPSILELLEPYMPAARE
jgi:hypothetical protein